MEENYPKGTGECPICGFDKPHTHMPSEIAARDTFNAAQRAGARKLAESQYKMTMLRDEFEANPRAYVARYGTINSVESLHLVEWLLARIDRLEAACASTG